MERNSGEAYCRQGTVCRLKSFVKAMHAFRKRFDFADVRHTEPLDIRPRRFCSQDIECVLSATSERLIGTHGCQQWTVCRFYLCQAIMQLLLAELLSGEFRLQLPEF
jgi:hypothetical protein